jgi:DNA repair exonuclease SbcCD ATPase subunit
MNELKPEDVMRALDILDKMDFFQGQRAGRELWFEKPFEVQEQDIADFSQGIAFVKNLIADADARALIREMKKQIRELEGDVENFKSIAEYQQNCNIKRYHQLQEKYDQLAEKDAEIERLTAELSDARRDCAVAEQNHYECKKELEETSDDILDSVRSDRDRYKAESERYQRAFLKAHNDAEQDRFTCKNICEPTYKNLLETARSEAITEFAEKLKEAVKYIPWCDYPPVHTCIDQIAEKMKGELDEN